MKKIIAAITNKFGGKNCKSCKYKDTTNCPLFGMPFTEIHVCTKHSK